MDKNKPLTLSEQLEREKFSQDQNNSKPVYIVEEKVEEIKFGNPYRDVYVQNKKDSDAKKLKEPKEPKTGKKRKKNSPEERQKEQGLLDKLNNG